MTKEPSTVQAASVRLGGKRSGAWLARYALEQLPVSHTFGIPGVHTTELYDELSQSDTIRPILVTHEGCGAFAADAVSRTGTPHPLSTSFLSSFFESGREFF